MSKFGAMKLAINFGALCFTLLISSFTLGQTPARTPEVSSEAAQLEALSKKIDEQNAKIDTLSQQILKLEQQISNIRPGVLIGEGAPSPSPSPSSAESPRPTNGNTHTVARGETLTSIAKIHNVSVSELQKYNHIENDRKLQIGQTIMIPPSPTASPSASSPAQ